MNNLSDVKWIRSFVAVVEHGSMAMAAAELGYVPSAVTQHIGSLERVLGVELLVRRPGSRISITAAGRALLASAGPLLRANAEFADSLRSISRSETASLVLGTYATAMQYLLPSVLKDMQAGGLLPELSLREMETPDALPLIRGGALDVLLGYRYIGGDPPTAADSLSVTLIDEEPMLLIAPAGRALTFEECVAGDWAIGNQLLGDRRLLRQWSERLHFRPRVSFESTDSNCLMTLVASGLAVSLLPATVVAAGIGRGEDVQIVAVPPGTPRLHRDVLVVTRPTFRPPFLDSFIGLLRDTLGRAEELVGSRVERKRPAVHGTSRAARGVGIP
jgi:DNA-binding transcriptional LysR family regulator